MYLHSTVLLFVFVYIPGIVLLGTCKKTNAQPVENDYIVVSKKKKNTVEEGKERLNSSREKN